MKAFAKTIEKVKFTVKAPAKKMCEYINDYTRAMIMASSINKQLEKYRGVNAGKDVYIVAGGPSVKRFNHEKGYKDIYIGINRAYKDERLAFDYLFAQDHFKEGFDDFLKYRGEECKKLLAVIPSNESFRIKEYQLKGNYERFVLASRRMGSVPLDISIEPVADLRGTVFSALQFAVYTNPDNIYLVGVDCSNDNNVFNEKDNDYRYQLEGWAIMKQALIDMDSIDKVTSINPIGLKGLFNDIYTR